MYMFRKEAPRKPSHKSSDPNCDVGYVWVRVSLLCGLFLSYCLCRNYSTVRFLLLLGVQVDRLINVNYSTSMYWNVTFLTVSVFMFTNADIIEKPQRNYGIMKYTLCSGETYCSHGCSSEAQAVFGHDLNPSSQFYFS